MSDWNRRDFLKASSLSAFVFSITGKNSWSASRPNLLIVFPDQFRAQALGFRNEDPVITPNLDQFAGESMFFSNAVSNRPLCSPFRGMLMTGRWPHSTGLTTNCNSSVPDNYLRESEETITDVLSDEGYSVGYIGKWHMDFPLGATPVRDWHDAVWDSYTPPGPMRHGVDYWYSYGTDNDHLTPHYWIEDATEAEVIYFNEYSAEHEATIAGNYIKNTAGQRDPDKPFALIVSMNPPHPKFSQVPASYQALYTDKTPEELLILPNFEDGYETALNNVKYYFSAVTAIDQAFGEILQALEDSGQVDNTIVVFSSDHGEMMGSHGRMNKGIYYEEAFRIPLMIRWPGQIQPGTDDLLINVPDYMPTLLGLMGFADRIPSQVEGVDRSPVLLGQSMQRPTSSFYLSDTDYSYKEVNVKRGIRTDRYTYVIEKQEDGTFTEVLFDNREDPYQLAALSVTEQSELASELRSELETWLLNTNDPYADQFIDIMTLSQAALAAYYPFNENDGSGTLHDSAGGADGTVHNAGFEVSGIASETLGNAGSFNGTDSYVQFGSGDHPSEFDLGTGDFSISGWFKCATNTANENRLMFYCGNKNHVENPGWFFRIGRADRTYRGQLLFTIQSVSVFSGVRVDDGGWHFVSVVRSGGTMTMYLDGTTAVDSITSSGSATAAAALEAYFGGNGASDSYEGLLDEWKIYNTALSVGVVDALWQKGAA